MLSIHGSCHCGNIGFELSWPVDTREIPVRACNCTFCTKHRGTYTSHPEAELEAVVEDAAALGEYRFGTGTADFLVCRRCGVVPLVTSRIEGRLYAVVNVNTFDSPDDLAFDCATTDFDGEDQESRLARRRRTWIANVHVLGV